jgi:hypothetical protein
MVVKKILTLEATIFKANIGKNDKIEILYY